MSKKEEKKLKTEEDKDEKKKEDKKLKSEGKRQTNKENPEQLKKVEAELEGESSSEEEGTAKVTLVGYLHMKLTKNWKPMYCQLIGGSFYYYKGSTDQEPKGHIDLEGHKIISPVEKEKKSFTFAIQKGDDPTPILIGSCSSETELGKWKACLEESLTKKRSDPPAVVAQKARKPGVMKRAKKNAVSVTATSALGKKVMKAIVNEETTTLLTALKRIVKSESGSEKKAEDLEKNILKIAVKSFLLIEDKKLTADDFLVADKPLRESFELMVKVFNGRGRVREEKIREALEKVEDLLKKAEEVITNLLAPHLTSKNMLRISSSFGCIANTDFLMHVFNDAQLEEDLDKLIDAMEYYTQFHYH